MHPFIKKGMLQRLETFFINDCLQTDGGEDSCESFCFSSKNRSAEYARNRMKLLLVSERIGCSLQMMDLLKGRHDPYSKKYVSIDEEGVVFWMSGTSGPSCRHTGI